MVMLAEPISDCRRWLRRITVFDHVTGLNYDGARWYSPSLGRFISPDPAGYPGAAAQSRCLGTGFCVVDDTKGFGLSPNALNPNDADTYQLLGSIT